LSAGDNVFVVRLRISAVAYQRMYSGEASHVLAEDLQGRRVRFPASALRPFVTRIGVNGVFELRVDAANRLIDIRRRGD
jgi:hypothetical protein